MSSECFSKRNTIWFNLFSILYTLWVDSYNIFNFINNFHVIYITTGLNKNCKTFIKSIKEWSQILLGLLNEAKMIFYEKRIELKNQKGSFFYNIKYYY